MLPKPQVTIGLDRPGGPASLVEAFEGNKAETLYDAAVIRHFEKADNVPERDRRGRRWNGPAERRRWRSRRAGVHHRARTQRTPSVIEHWQKSHPDQTFTHGQIFTQPWPASPSDGRRDHWFYYQYSADRARRTLRGIEEQVRKAEKALAGQAAVKRNRFVKLTGGTRTLDQALVDKTRSLAGIKGYVTNLPPHQAGPDFVIGAYHRLFGIEKSFRMAKSDLAARPIYARKRESIDAHLNIVLAAMAVARWIEDATGWSIRRFVTTARQHRTITIRIDGNDVLAETPLPDDLQQAIHAIESRQRTARRQH